MTPIRFVFWPDSVTVNAFKGDLHYRVAGLATRMSFSDLSCANASMRQTLHDFLVIKAGARRYYFSDDAGELGEPVGYDPPPLVWEGLKLVARHR